MLARDPSRPSTRRVSASSMRTAVERGGANEELTIGICGEHGGDPASIAFSHELGLDYVSCSPYRVPVALAAAARRCSPRRAPATSSPARRGGGRARVDGLPRRPRAGLGCVVQGAARCGTCRPENAIPADHRPTVVVVPPASALRRLHLSPARQPRRGDLHREASGLAPERDIMLRPASPAARMRVRPAGGPGRTRSRRLPPR